MNKRDYSNLPEHLPQGKLAFNDSTNELFVGAGENAPLQKVTNKDIEDELKDASVDYMGNNHKSLKKAIDSNVDWLLGEINTVHYDGQHITATDTIEKQVKSAILKGQTLVNLCSNKTNDFVVRSGSSRIDGDGKIVAISSGTNGDFIAFKDLNTRLKASTVYTVIIDLENLNDYEINNFLWISYSKYEDSVFVNGLKLNQNERLVYKRTFTTRDESYGDVARVDIKHNINGQANGEVKIHNVVLLEGDYTNVDIPYFEGMQSVKMPVLTTSNLGNLLKREMLQQGMFNNSSGAVIPTMDMIISDFIPRNFDEYTLSHSGSWCWTKIFEYDEEKGFIQGSATRGNSHHTSTLNEKTKFIRIGIEQSFSLVDTIGIKLCPYTSQNSQPYKSNILSASEDVVLRGIGDVQDTLDCLTGEVTQRVGEIKLGNFDAISYSSTIFEGYYTAVLGINNKASSSLIMSNLVPTRNFNNSLDCGIYNNPTNIVLFKKGATLEEIKNLVSNLIVQYQLAEKSIKTVDLKGQKVYSYKDTTHYDCSSADGSLVPTLSIDVPTNLPAVVTRQRETIQQLELENSELKNTIAIVDAIRESGDLELLSSDFDLDFRLMEIEFALDIATPMSLFKGVKTMARTPYEMAKTLILGGKYDRADMEYKLGRYLERKQITQDQYDELMALMDATELVG